MVIKTEITYAYDANNHITSIVSLSLSPGNYINKEQHCWFYDANGNLSAWKKLRTTATLPILPSCLTRKDNPGEEKVSARDRHYLLLLLL